MSNVISEYLVVSECLKTQILFSASENNTITPVSIIPSTDTAFKQSLQAKFPNSLIQSSLDIKMLEFRVKIGSIAEYVLPQVVLDGLASPVEANRALLQSMWTAERKQIDVLHQINPSASTRVRGELTLLNKGTSESYYLEEFLSVLTSQATYPLSPGEDVLLSLKDVGYGLLSAADEILFAGIFTHYMAIIE